MYSNYRVFTKQVFIIVLFFNLLLFSFPEDFYKAQIILLIHFSLIPISLSLPSPQHNKELLKPYAF